jgi:hypothetical protein
MRLLQALIMAAIVATLLCLPTGALLAVLAYAALDVPLEGFLTFGGALSLFAGLLAWWLLAFLPSLVYTAFAMPGRED